MSPYTHRHKPETASLTIIDVVSTSPELQPGAVRIAGIDADTESIISDDDDHHSLATEKPIAAEVFSDDQELSRRISQLETGLAMRDRAIAIRVMDKS